MTEGEKLQKNADMAAMKMDEAPQLAFLLCSLHTGRPASSADIAGARWGMRAGDMVGGQAHRKTKRRNYDDVLDSARLTLDHREHELWIANLLERLDSNMHPYAQWASLLILCDMG